MTVYYYNQYKCSIMLLFQSSDGGVHKGFVVPLDIIQADNCIGGKDLPSLEKILAPAKDAKNCIKLDVYLNQFAVPGIGFQRSFMVVIGAKENVQTHEGLALLQLSDIMPLLRGMRKHGRPIIIHSLKGVMFDRYEKWSSLPIAHLLLPVGTDIPLVNDSFVADVNGLYSCEVEAVTVPKKNEAELTCLREVPHSVIRDSIIVKEKSAAMQGKTHYFDSLDADQKALAIAALIQAYNLLPNTPEAVFAVLADPNQRTIVSGNNRSLNPLFAVLVVEWSGTAFDIICRKWYMDIHDTGASPSRILPTGITQNIVHEFEIKGDDFKIPVLCLDHVSNPLDAFALTCIHCRLEGVHYSIKCCLVTGRLERAGMFSGRCAGCHGHFCQLGYAPHENMKCTGCGDNTHIYEACCDAVMWKEEYWPAIRRQQFILAAVLHLELETICQLKTDLIGAFIKFKCHSKDFQ